MENLIPKLESGKAVIGIMGLGYVGLPLATAFSQHFKVIGYDPNAKIVHMLKSKKSHIADVSDNEILDTFSAHSDSSVLKDCDIIIMVVPTPLAGEKEPDLTFIKSATRTIANQLRSGQFIILESTTYPGTTEELVKPMLEESGLKVGHCFGLAFSPERIDPGNPQYKVKDIPKIVGGINKQSTDIAVALYSKIIPHVHRVSSPRVAEAAKILENTYRSVNIALVNELAVMFDEMNIDIWEVIEAAKTKPFGFQGFTPGPGIGGHCIPLDPYYLAWKARRYGFFSRFIELAGEVNDFMKIYTVNLIEKGLRTQGKELRGSTVAVMGLAYKKDVDDSRESPSIKVIEELIDAGADVKVHDPFVKSIRTKFGVLRPVQNPFAGADCAVFMVDHTTYKTYTGPALKSLVVIDTKNLFNAADMEGVVYLAIGKPNKRKA